MTESCVLEYGANEEEKESGDEDKWGREVESDSKDK
jgi:hypothetical protein